MNREIRFGTPRRRSGNDRGQSLVELAIALPILLALVIGIFEFGLAWNRRQVITNAAREGARVLVLPQVPADSAEAVVVSYLTTANLDPSLASISVNENGGNIGQSSTVEVSYPHQFRFLGPIVAFLQGDDSAMAGTIMLSTTAVMRNE